MDNLLPFNSFGLIITNKCNSSCAHCLVSSGPMGKDSLNDEQVDIVLRQVRQLWDEEKISGKDTNEFWLHEKKEVRKGIHIAGGEPFTDYSKVLRTIKRATELDIYVEFVQSNGVFGSDPKAEEKLKDLKSAGLTRMMLSRSPFHAEVVSNKTFRRAYELCCDIFGKENVVVNFISSMEVLEEIDKDSTVPLEKYIEHVGLEEFQRYMKEEYKFEFKGRGYYRLKHLFPTYPIENVLEQNCRMELLESRHSHIDCYENYVPLACTGITLGNALELVDLYKNFDIEKFPVVNALVSKGLKGLLEIGKTYGYEEKEKGYYDKCHLCWDIRDHLVKNNCNFEELMPRIVYFNFWQIF